MPIGRIQREARGLLPFLDIVGQQERPVAISEIVSGQVDLLPFYGTGVLRGVGNTANVQNVNDRVTFTVPQGQAHMLLALQGEVTTGAVGEDALVSVGIGTANLAFVRLASSNGRALSAGFPVGSRLFVSATLGQPVLLTAGQTIELDVNATTLAAPRAASVFGLVYEFTI